MNNMKGDKKRKGKKGEREEGRKEKEKKEEEWKKNGRKMRIEWRTRKVNCEKWEKVRIFYINGTFSFY